MLPMVCNTSNHTQRGIRCNRCKLVREKSEPYLSAHILGKAGDFTVVGLSAEEARQSIHKMRSLCGLMQINWLRQNCINALSSVAVPWGMGMAIGETSCRQPDVVFIYQIPNYYKGGPEERKKFYKRQLINGVCKTCARLIYNLNCGDGRIRTNVYWKLVPYTIPLPSYHLQYAAT